MKILNVVGARPNFMKIAAIQKEMGDFDCRLVHTGQHYDYKMSQIFFDDLGLFPDYNLDVGSGTHAIQTARVMIEFEKVLDKEQPDLVLVVGDVNSTVACALVAKKQGVKLAHVEAGCRSFDRRMPEEINRIVTDSISDYHFAIDQDSIDNLKREGIDGYLVGDTMIDAVRQVPYELVDIDDYCVVTLHRPENVDSDEDLDKCMEILGEVKTNIVFSVHPRVKGRIRARQNMTLIDPLGYKGFINLVRHSKFVITDSGSLQAETTYLGIPCLTMRDSTERTNTLSDGTNRLVGRSKEKVLGVIQQIYDGEFEIRNNILMYDGKAAERIAAILRDCIV
jgi:UDP-N-acetylglucosamine 2-epimerase (non-hydrolysing)